MKNAVAELFTRFVAGFPQGKTQSCGQTRSRQGNCRRRPNRPFTRSWRKAGEANEEPLAVVAMTVPSLSPEDPALLELSSAVPGRTRRRTSSHGHSGMRFSGKRQGGNAHHPGLRWKNSAIIPTCTKLRPPTNRSPMSKSNSRFSTRAAPFWRLGPPAPRRSLGTGADRGNILCRAAAGGGPPPFADGRCIPPVVWRPTTPFVRRWRFGRSDRALPATHATPSLPSPSPGR